MTDITRDLVINDMERIPEISTKVVGLRQDFQRPVLSKVRISPKVRTKIHLLPNDLEPRIYNIRLHIFKAPKFVFYEKC